MKLNKTKIVATLGPSSSSREMIKELMLAGVSVCRLNFSHGDNENKVGIIETIRSLNEELGLNTAILGDLQGPKIRVGEMQENQILENGKDVIITNQEVEGTSSKFSIRYDNFAQDVQPGENILLDDGKLMLQIKSTNGKDEVVATVKHGGLLTSRKGVNLPNTNISLPCLTPKDLVDLEFALDQDLDWIGLSFVRSARDIIELRGLISKRH